MRGHNIEQIQKECDSRNLQYDETTNWRDLIKLIKQDKGNNKYFTPQTEYYLFKWNETHFLPLTYNHDRTNSLVVVMQTLDHINILYQ